MVEREGFEPSKAIAGRFTVCSLWPLGHLSTTWSRWPESNWQPTDYKSVALPLSYIGSQQSGKMSGIQGTRFPPGAKPASYQRFLDPVKPRQPPADVVHGDGAGHRGVERLDPGPLRD